MSKLNLNNMGLASRKLEQAIKQSETSLLVNEHSKLKCPDCGEIYAYEFKLEDINKDVDTFCPHCETKILKRWHVSFDQFVTLEVKGA